MAHYTGPVCRLCRRLGDKLYIKGEKCFSPKCSFERRPFAPGQRSMRRRKVSDRGLQLREKQRGRATYGVLERQFRRYYAEAVRRPGVSGDNLLRILEMRLDNLAYRLGFADSRAQGRQIALHGHISVNGRKASTPSHVLKVGDVIGWTPRGQRSQYFEMVKEQMASKSVPSWLSVDVENMTGRVLAQPEVEEIGAKFSPATIVEYYSR
ncbi:MAG: 30S ribosomal protein S4 [Actinobacteria bacterium RBG_13_63_9]|nr:MAG: 30S ribosomal protein S4 [Actinobacteria bacterium RBG_13_63_9]